VEGVISRARADLPPDLSMVGAPALRISSRPAAPSSPMTVMMMPSACWPALFATEL
jgi:hypothetical protein